MSTKRKQPHEVFVSLVYIYIYIFSRASGSKVMALASEKGTQKDVDIMDFSRSNGSTAGSKLCSSVLQIFRKETAITTVSMGSFLPDFFNFSYAAQKLCPL